MPPPRLLAGENELCVRAEGEALVSACCPAHAAGELTSLKLVMSRVFLFEGGFAIVVDDGLDFS